MELPCVGLCRMQDYPLPAADMPAELYFMLLRQDPEALAVLCGDTTVGAALFAGGAEAFAVVYVLPAFRGRGLGAAAARALEERAAGARRVLTVYHADDAGAAAFAGRLGYRRRFSSACMEYRGGAFPEPDIAVRAYRDGDYDSAHALYAEAFHRMRLSVGDFPDSVPEPPGQRMREAWAETADERLVLLRHGAVVGYAHIEGNELCSVAVAPAMQGQGLGRAFVQRICNGILSQGHESVVLYCVEGNRARQMYDALGFTVRCVDVYAGKALVAVDRTGNG